MQVALKVIRNKKRFHHQVLNAPYTRPTGTKTTVQPHDWYRTPLYQRRSTAVCQTGPVPELTPVPEHVCGTIRGIRGPRVSWYKNSGARSTVVLGVDRGGRDFMVLRSGVVVQPGAGRGEAAGASARPRYGRQRSDRAHAGLLLFPEPHVHHVRAALHQPVRVHQEQQVPGNSITRRDVVE
eukprot:3613725-Rhodomonas_salina.2